VVTRWANESFDTHTKAMATNILGQK